MNPEPSSSSTTENRKRKIRKCGNGQAEKKIKEISEPENENQVRVESNSFFDKLPPEMVMKILEYLDTNSLRASHVVNRLWREIAYEILRSREDFEITIHWPRLKKFIQCFEDTKEMPLYTRFRFNKVGLAVFGQADWIKFISTFGESVKCLKLALDNANGGRAANERKLAKAVGDLLLNELPNLQEFGLTINSSTDDSSQVKLFPINPSNKETRAAAQLPRLKVLYFNDLTISSGTQMVTDLLGAAVNLERIENFERDDPFELSSYGSPQTFHFLQSLRKLGCLQAAYIKTSRFLAPDNNQDNQVSIATELLKLKKLDLNIDCEENNNPMILVSKLLESSKDILTQLTLITAAVWTQLQLPVFSKLTHLCFINQSEAEHEILSEKTDLAKTFPALQILGLSGWWAGFIREDDTCFPTINRLVIPAFRLTVDDIVLISEVCPNLRRFRTYRQESEQPIKKFPEVGRAIWTHLSQLQSLELCIDASSPANAFPAIDATITGFSEDYCQKLYNSIDVEKSAKPREISEAELNAQRKNPSVLNLTELKNFKIRLVCVPQYAFDQASSDDDNYVVEEEQKLQEPDQEEEEEEEPKLEPQDLSFESDDDGDHVEEKDEELQEYAAEEDPLQQNSESEEQDSDAKETLELKKKALTFISKEWAFKLVENLNVEIQVDEDF